MLPECGSIPAPSVPTWKSEIEQGGRCRAAGRAAGRARQSHGLRVMPVSGEWQAPIQPNSGSVVLPRTGQPASRKRAVAGASSPSQCPASRAPRRVGKPLSQTLSLMVGRRRRPALGPPFCQRASDSFAAARAPSRSRMLNALIAGLKASIRARSRVTSTGESSRRERRRRLVAVRDLPMRSGPPELSKDAVVADPGRRRQRRRPGTEQTPMVPSSLGRCHGVRSRAAAQRLAGTDSAPCETEILHPIENPK